MSIKGYIDELEKLNIEIKRNNERNRFLRQRVKELEYNISEYLRSKDQPGIKYNGRAIVVENTEKRPPKNKKDKEYDITAILEDLGVADTTEAYKQIIEAQKGAPVEHQKIKFKKLK